MTTKILLVDCGSSYMKYLREALSKHTTSFDEVKIDRLDEVNLEKFSGIVFSGSPTLFMDIDVDYYLNKSKNCFASNIPLMGICFGHQLLGLAFDAEITIGDRIKGNEEIIPVIDSDLFKDLPEKFVQQENHREQLVLPKNFILLAKSKHTNVEVMKHSSKPFFGLQFHPEISGSEGEKIFKNFIEIVKNHKP